LLLNKKSLYEEFNKLKRKNPQLKTLLSLGGASAGVDKFRKLCSSDEDRKKFIKSTIESLRKHNFDGLDLDWEFPETSQDRTGFTKLVKVNWVTL
jgi:GH18 family chitinase